MTIEEAIRLLDPETTREAIAEIEYYNGFSGKAAAIGAIVDASVLAVEALRKQIPKKPVKSDRENVRYSLVYDCPGCGRSFSGTGIADYCYHCGQALIWSDE